MLALDEGTVENDVQAAVRKTAFREVTLMKSLSHPNIVRYEHSFCDEANLYIVMEYAERGDLSQVCSHPRSS